MNADERRSRRYRARRRRGRGFTLVELLIVLAILMTIAAIAIPNLMAAVNQAKVAKAVGDVHALETDISTYVATTDKLPDTLADMGRDTLRDPWGRPYCYLNHSTMTVKSTGLARKDRFLVPLNSDYDLYSMGKDGQSSAPITAKNSQDDIIRASDGSYVGLASNF